MNPLPSPSPVPNPEAELLAALRELEAGATVPPAQRPDFLALFNRIDVLGAGLPPGTDPLLRHFLQGKSYQKARLFLEGRASEVTHAPGRCGS